MPRAAPALRIVGGTTIDPAGTQTAPEIQIMPPVSAVGHPGVWRHHARFAFALTCAAVLHAALLAATLHSTASPEARADGGSSDEIVVEGVSLVKMDSLPSPAAPDLPSAKPMEAAEASPVPPDVTVQQDAKSNAQPGDSLVVASADDTPPTPSDRSSDAVQADAAPATATDAAATGNADIPATPVTTEDAATPPTDARQAMTADKVAADVLPVAEPTDAPGAAAPDEIAPVARLDETPRTPPIKPAKPRAVQKPSQPHVASVSDPVAKGPTAGTAGAGGRSTDERGSAIRSDYQAQLAARLRRFRVFPAEAEERGLHGVVRVTFTVRADGALASATLAASSGAAILDSAALAMVRRAAPFPPIPAELRQASLSVTVPVRFDRDD